MQIKDKGWNDTRSSQRLHMLSVRNIQCINIQIPEGEREREREKYYNCSDSSFSFLPFISFPLFFSHFFFSLSLSLSLSLFSFIIFLLFAAIPSETKSNYESNYETLNTLEEFFSPKGAPLDKKRISPPCN